MKNEKVKALLIDLENGIRDFKNTETYLKYLDFVSKFHQYSYHNRVLINRQLDGARLCKGFVAWGELNRKVKKGEKALSILAPVLYSKIVEKDGEEVEEEHLFFKVVKVFDISQTEVIKGKEDLAPAIITGLKGDTNLVPLFEKVAELISGIKVEYKDIKGAVKGYYSPMENKIVIQKGLSQVQKAKTIIHELAHSILHKDFDYSNARGQAETEAESIAYIVCNYFGVDTAEYSFQYVNGWANDDVKLLKNSLNDIEKTAIMIIEKIEKLNK